MEDPTRRRKMTTESSQEAGEEADQSCCSSSIASSSSVTGRELEGNQFWCHFVLVNNRFSSFSQQQNVRSWIGTAKGGWSRVHCDGQSQLFIRLLLSFAVRPESAMYCFLKSRRISRLISYFLQGIVHNPLPLVVQKKSVHTLVTAETAAIPPWLGFFSCWKGNIFLRFFKDKWPIEPARLFLFLNLWRICKWNWTSWRRWRSFDESDGWKALDNGSDWNGTAQEQWRHEK